MLQGAYARHSTCSCLCPMQALAPSLNLQVAAWRHELSVAHTVAPGFQIRATDAVATALWALVCHFDAPLEAVVAAAHQGGDTDTIAGEPCAALEACVCAVRGHARAVVVSRMCCGAPLMHTSPRCMMTRCPPTRPPPTPLCLAAGMTGAMAGALHGSAWLPGHWLEHLEEGRAGGPGREAVLQLASQLALLDVME